MAKSGVFLLTCVLHSSSGLALVLPPETSLFHSILTPTFQMFVPSLSWQKLGGFLVGTKWRQPKRRDVFWCRTSYVTSIRLVTLDRSTFDMVLATSRDRYDKQKTRQDKTR